MKQTKSFVQHLPDRADSGQLLDALVDFLTAGSPAVGCMVFVRDVFSGEFVLCRSLPEGARIAGGILPPDAALVEYFRRNPGAILTLLDKETLAQSECVSGPMEQLRSLGLAVCAPMFSRGQLLGFIGVSPIASETDHSAWDRADLAELTWHVGPFLDHLMAIEAQELIGRISRGLAHDAQGLLTPVSALMQFVEAGGKANLQKAAQLIPVAKESLRILEELLQHARSGSGTQLPHRSSVRVDEVAARGARSVQAEMDEKGITLAMDLQPVTASVDETLIVRLIRNLVINSRNAVPAGGWIRLTAQSLAGGLEGKPAFRLSVTDSGPGFEAGKLQQIQRRSLAAMSGDNLRTGLLICRWIVHLHAGRMDIFSQRGEPTRVQVDLPV